MRRPLLVVGGLILVTAAMRLLMVAGGGQAFTPIPSLVFPDDYTTTRLAGNPVIDVANNPAGGIEQYVPAPILLPNGDIHVYVKGLGQSGNTIFVWISTDGGETFSLGNSGDPVVDVAAGTWEEDWLLEPAAIYDDSTDTIHLYYKATNVAAANANWAWGHATADGDTPTVFTKDAGNPILTSSEAGTLLGGTIGGDLAIHNVLKVGGTFHFFGYGILDGDYTLMHGTGSDWDDVSTLEALYTADEAGVTELSSPGVFQLPSGGWVMMYSAGSSGGANSRRMILATSDDLDTWDFSDTTPFMEPVASTWESHWTYAASMLKDGLTNTPYTDGSGRWLLYFSGYDGSQANSGLAYIEPD